MIDWDRIQELRREVGDEDFAMILELFLSEVDTCLSRLQAADQAQLAAEMHFLKGCALNLGFNNLGKLCSEGERLANKGQPLPFGVPVIADVYEQSKQTLLHALPKLRAGKVA